MGNYLTDKGGGGDGIAGASMENREDNFTGGNEEECTREEIRRNSLKNKNKNKKKQIKR